MTNWRIRDFHSADLDGILHLWEECGTAGASHRASRIAIQPLIIWGTQRL